MTDTTATISDDEIVRIVTDYYAAVDSMNSDRITSTYLPDPNTPVQFNADEPIVGADALRAFSEGFFNAVKGIRHTRIEVWTRPLMGDVLPVDPAITRSEATVTVVSTALPTYTIGEGENAQTLSVPATSIFTIDIASGKLAAVHNMFDVGKVYAAVQSHAAN